MAQKFFVPLIILTISFIPQSFNGNSSFEEEEFILRHNMLLNDSGLNADALGYGLTGCRLLSEMVKPGKSNLLTIIDYSLPSCADRFYVIDLNNKTVLYKSLVAHGKNSGETQAGRFSNKVHSHQSSLGFFITGSTYNGGQGYSMIMNGIDTGFNDNAVKRAIVMHGAEYVSENYIRKYGRLGRSFGCPALPVNINRQVIDLIRDGSVVFCYYPDSSYLEGSVILNRDRY